MQELADHASLLANAERAAERGQGECRRHRRRPAHGDRTVLAEGPRHAFRGRGAGEERDVLWLHLVHHALDRRERLEHLEPKQDALGDRQEIGKPDPVHRERRLARAGRPPRGDEPRAEVGQRIGLGLERLLVVEAQAHAGRQGLAIHELAARQERDVVARTQPRERRRDSSAVATDVSGVERTHPPPAELPVAPRRLRDDEHATHRCASRAGTPITVVPGGTSSMTTAPAATIAPAPILTPGTTTAPAPRNAPRSTVTSPDNTTPGER